MRIRTKMLLAFSCLTATALAAAQPPGAEEPVAPAGVAAAVERMMAFDKNKDGKLTRAEVTDARLHGLFDRADADKDGTVTRAELTQLLTREALPAGGFGPGKGGFGPPGKGAKGGKGGFGGPPRPGQILPPFLQQALKLSPAQQKQLADLQKQVDDGLEKILTAEQQKQLKDMGNRGPSGPGGGGERPPAEPRFDGPAPPK